MPLGGLSVRRMVGCEYSEATFWEYRFSIGYFWGILYAAPLYIGGVSWYEVGKRVEHETGAVEGKWVGRQERFSRKVTRRLTTSSKSHGYLLTPSPFLGSQLGGGNRRPHLMANAVKGDPIELDRCVESNNCALLRYRVRFDLLYNDPEALRVLPIMDFRFLGRRQTTWICIPGVRRRQMAKVCLPAKPCRKRFFAAAVNRRLHTAYISVLREVLRTWLRGFCGAKREDT